MCLMPELVLWWLTGDCLKPRETIRPAGYCLSTAGLLAMCTVYRLSMEVKSANCYQRSWCTAVLVLITLLPTPPPKNSEFCSKKTQFCPIEMKISNILTNSILFLFKRPFQCFPGGDFPLLFIDFDWLTDWLTAWLIDCIRLGITVGTNSRARPENEPLCKGKKPFTEIMDPEEESSLDPPCSLTFPYLQVALPWPWNWKTD